MRALHHRRSLPLALLSLLVLSQVASAQEPTLDDAREALLHADYGRAITMAEALLGQGAAAEQNGALEVLATAHLANGDEAAANATLDRLYQRDPGHQLNDPDASPVVQAAFQRARSRAGAPVPVRIEHIPPAPRRRASPSLEVQLAEGADAVQEVQVRYRAAGAPRFATAVVDLENGNGTVRLPLLGTGETAQVMEYFFVALAPSRTPIAGLGSESEPIRLTVPAADEALEVTPIEPGEGPEASEGGSKWWIALIVVGVAGAAVGGYFLLRGDEPSGSLGSVRLGN